MKVITKKKLILRKRFLSSVPPKMLGLYFLKISYYFGKLEVFTEYLLAYR